MDLRSKVLNDPKCLEDWELLSVLWGSGRKGQDVYSLARALLLESKGLMGLVRWTPERLLAFSGLGRAHVAALFAGWELSLRSRPVTNPSLSFTDIPPDVFPSYRFLMDFWRISFRERIEVFQLITLDRSRKLIAMHRLTQGGEMDVCLRKKDLAMRSLRDNARFAVLAHNHPFSSKIPSEDDISLYSEAKRFLLELEVILIDHWVLGEDGIFSIAENKSIL